ncbi:hypothetical protein BBP40_002312 [Aspergillus hancockii]|nr:hypothetical protein BBP40_002312 [Aspergillus hancockii]
MIQSTSEEAGSRSLYVVTSARYGESGISLLEGQTAGLTVKGTTNGSLFYVSIKLDTLLLHGLLDMLEKSGAADMIWNKTNEFFENVCDHATTAEESRRAPAFLS